MTEPLAISEVLDRLRSGPWRVMGLPTMRGQGLYLVAQGERYFWFELDGRGRSVSRYQAMDREGAHEFLARYTPESGYPGELLVSWTDGADRLRAALDRTEALLGRLRDEPGRCVRVMGRWWAWTSPWFGWVLCLPNDERVPKLSVWNDSRVASEIMSMVLADPEHDLETPPAEIVACRDDFCSRASALFEAHGPTPDRILWLAVDGERREGLVRDRGGRFVELTVKGDGEGMQLEVHRTSPLESAHERSFESFERGRLTHGSTVVPESLRSTLDGAADPDTLAQWLLRGEVVIKCGEYRPDSWISDSPTTLLDTYKGDSLPLRQALAPFLRDGWIEVRFESLVSLSDVARAHDDPQAPSVRYTIPKGWAYRVARERSIERALEAVVLAASGRTDPLPRVEETIGRGSGAGDGAPEREPSRRVTLGDSSLGVVLSLDPIESGHGVHGEHVSFVFHGLPTTLRVTGHARLDMRAGGELSLDLEGPAADVMRIKQACLDALP